LHDRVYCLATGAGIGNECSIRVYPVTVRDGVLLVDPVDTLPTPHP